MSAAAHSTRDRGPAHGAGDPPALHAHLVPRPPPVSVRVGRRGGSAAPSPPAVPIDVHSDGGQGVPRPPSRRTSSTRTSVEDEQHRSRPSGRPSRLDVRAEIASGDRDPGLGTASDELLEWSPRVPGRHDAARADVVRIRPARTPRTSRRTSPPSVPRSSPDLEERRPAPATGSRQAATIDVISVLALLTVSLCQPDHALAIMRV